MDQEPAITTGDNIVVAAGCICKAPSGRVLLLHRTDGEGWAWPGGVLKDSETAEQAAWREVWEECKYRLGDVGVQLMRSVKNGVDYTTFLTQVESEFIPVMNHEHDSFMWADPEAVLLQAKVADSSGAVSRADSMARADATPVAGGEGHAELAASLEQGMLAEEAERVAGQDRDLEGELASAASEGPEPMLPTPAYPPPLAGEDQALLGNDENDDDDLDDETLDLCLSVIEDLEARLARLEEGVRD